MTTPATQAPRLPTKEECAEVVEYWSGEIGDIIGPAEVAIDPNTGHAAMARAVNWLRAQNEQQARRIEELEQRGTLALTDTQLRIEALAETTRERNELREKVDNLSAQFEFADLIRRDVAQKSDWLAEQLQEARALAWETARALYHEQENTRLATVDVFQGFGGEDMEAYARRIASGEETVLVKCPQCFALVEDHDGFGVLAHVGEGGCGYCNHPSRDGDGNGGWVCGICGDVRIDAPQPAQSQAAGAVSAATGETE